MKIHIAAVIPTAILLPWLSGRRPLSFLRSSTTRRKGLTPLNVNRTIWRPGQPSQPMKTIWQLPTLFFVTVLLAATLPAADYFPPRGEWAAKPPAELGFDAAKLQLAIDFSIGREN